MITDPGTPADEELAREAQSGSLECFEELVRRYETRLYRFLARLCRNDADGADLTQETLVTAYTKLGSYDPSQSFATWLFIIARRKCIDHLRTQRPVDEKALPESMDEDSPAELAARRDEQSDLWQRARAVLSEVQFQAVWLKYVEELNVAEIANVLRRTQTHVKVILFRARTALAAAMDVPPGEKRPLAKAAMPGTPASSRSTFNLGKTE